MKHCICQAALARGQTTRNPIMGRGMEGWPSKQQGAIKTAERAAPEPAQPRYCCRGKRVGPNAPEALRGSLRTALLPRPRTTRSILTTQYASSFHSQSSGEETDPVSHVTVPHILWGKSKPEHVNKISCFVTTSQLTSPQVKKAKH